MPRSRSKSPRRDRKRSRSRDRERDRDRDKDKQRRHRRSRSRSKDRRRRSRSRERRYDRDRGNRGGGHRRRQDSDSDDEMVIFTESNRPTVTEEDIKELPEEDQDLMRMMGFTGFDSTKDKQVVGNDVYAANICKKRRYRQYMNRKGGFNRPLDFIA